jgi:CelD/BcsL family acetyltransferase involved in cellulose biosynthesis
MLEVKCIKNISDLNAIADQWEQLLAQSIHNSYALSWSWISHWVDTFIEQNQLFCIAVYDCDRLVGLGPFWIEHKKQLLYKTKILRFIGSREVCPDHLDLIVHTKNSENICNAIWEHLFGYFGKEWDIWEYHNISTDSRILQIFRKLSDQDSRCCGLIINEYTVCPYINLPETWEVYQKSLSYNQRRALKVSDSLLANAGSIEVKFCNSVKELPEFLETHIKLHRQSWNERGKKGSFATEKFRRFHNKFAEDQLKSNKLFLCNLELDQKPIGSFYGFIYNNVLLYYLIGTNRNAVPKASVGRVLIAKCIEESIKRKLKKFDFLRGFESYKYDWTDTEQRELLVTFYNRTFHSLYYILESFISSFGRQIMNVVFKENFKTVKRLLGRGQNISQKPITKE